MIMIKKYPGKHPMLTTKQIQSDLITSHKTVAFYHNITIQCKAKSKRAISPTLY